MASRRKGRILALQALYAWDISGNLSLDDLPDLKPGKTESQAEETEENIPFPDFSRLLVAGTIENIADIDKMIRNHLQNWDISRVSKVDLAILRMSVFGLMYQRDMAPSIIINEAISISKEYGTDDSYRFINGVLDGIRKSLANEAEPKT
jgi:N utilization substance protein B